HRVFGRWRNISLAVPSLRSISSTSAIIWNPWAGTNNPPRPRFLKMSSREPARNTAKHTGYSPGRNYDNPRHRDRPDRRDFRYHGLHGWVCPRRNRACGGDYRPIVWLLVLRSYRSLGFSLSLFASVGECVRFFHHLHWDRRRGRVACAIDCHALQDGWAFVARSPAWRGDRIRSRSRDRGGAGGRRACLRANSAAGFDCPFAADAVCHRSVRYSRDGYSARDQERFRGREDARTEDVVGAGKGGIVSLLIFDLDGTLIDSKLDLANSVNATLDHFELPQLSHERINSYVGNGSPVLMRSALGPEASEAEVHRALAWFLDYYRDHMLDYTRTYPGVMEALESFQENGVRMAVLTNKPVRFSEGILDGL